MAMDFNTYMAGAFAKAGKSLDEIIAELKQEGFTKKGTTATNIKNYLNTKYDIGHGHAMGIWRVFKPLVEE